VNIKQSFQGKIEMIHVVLPFCSKQVSVEPVRFAS